MNNMGKQFRPPGSGKKRKYGDMDIEKIITAAMEIIRRDGALKLTMMALAEELGISKMAIYHYVPSKEMLFDLVTDRLYSNFSLLGTPGSPEEKIRTLFWQILETKRQYPGIQLIAPLDHISAGSLRLHAEFDQLFMKMGCDYATRNAAYLLYTMFIYGLASIEVSRGLTVEQLTAGKEAVDRAVSLIGTALRSIARKEPDGEETTQLLRTDRIG